MKHLKNFWTNGSAVSNVTSKSDNDMQAWCFVKCIEICNECADACEEDMDECARYVENVLKYVNYVLGLRE
jgi:hypothetical protein